jgi:hypothetical protein
MRQSTSMVRRVRCLTNCTCGSSLFSTTTSTLPNGGGVAADVETNFLHMPEMPAKDIPT